MKTIVVCIKQVPETEKVQVNTETNTLVREGIPTTINPYDLYALELAVSLKEKEPEKYRVLAISMGPLQAKSVLEYALSVGADEAILLSDRAFAGADAWVTAYTLSQAVKQINRVDFIICGKQAIDGETGQVGPGIAEFLNLPHIPELISVEKSDSAFIFKSEREDGIEILEAEPPLVLIVGKNLNTPRYPSLKGKMRAKSAVIPIWTQEEIKADPACLGLKGSPTQVTRVFPAAVKGQAELLTGTCDECVPILVQKIKQAIKGS